MSFTELELKRRFRKFMQRYRRSKVLRAEPF